MPEALVHSALTWIEIGLAALTFLLLSFVVAPYGRHERAGYGKAVPQRIAWIAMEAPAVVVFIAIYALGEHALEPGPLCLLGLWQLHYLQRTFVFPFRLRDPTKTTPLAVVLSAIGFNVLNAYVNARWISHFGSYSLADFQSFHFLIGALMFVVGFALNIQADGALLRLRSPGSSGYKVPHGGLFEYVSSPNYLAELIEWFGWAILTWSLPGLAFALYAVGNLVPRALSNHRWYHQKFADYPKHRKAVLPFVL